MCSTDNSQENINMPTIIKKYSVFIAKFYQNRTFEMMREMEKVFETLKEEFNRKISSDSFISYFVKHNNVSEGSSCSDSFEDISMNTDAIPTSISERHSENEDLIATESGNEDFDKGGVKREDLGGENIIKEDYDRENIFKENIDTENIVSRDDNNVNNNTYTLKEHEDTKDCKTNEVKVMINESKEKESPKVLLYKYIDELNVEEEKEDVGGNSEALLIINNNKDIEMKEDGFNNKQIEQNPSSEVISNEMLNIKNEDDECNTLEEDKVSISEENNSTFEVNLSISYNDLKIDHLNNEKKTEGKEQESDEYEKKGKDNYSPCLRNDNKKENITNDEKEQINHDPYPSILRTISEGSDDQLLNLKFQENTKDVTSEVFIEDIAMDNIDVDVNDKEITDKKETLVQTCIAENIHRFTADHHVTFKSESEVFDEARVSLTDDIDNKEPKEHNEEENIKGMVEGLDQSKCEIFESKDMTKLIDSKFREILEEYKMKEVKDFVKELETSEESEDQCDPCDIILTYESPRSGGIENKEIKEAIIPDETIKPPKVKKQQEGSSKHKLTKKQSLHRMMWSEMPEVIESGIMENLPKKQIQLQEAMFEIITSEVSYYQNLMILTTHFFDSDLFKKDSLASSVEKHHIFSNIILIMSTSQKFLNDLEKRWLDEKPKLTQICDIIHKHANGDDFQNYVTYLRNQEYQSKALKHLSENEVFRQQLNKLENSSVCGKLSMDSYLMLPMQRLTRLKLLVDAILKVMYCEELRDLVPEEHIDIAEMSLEQLKKLLDDSDFQKGFMDQKTTLMLLMNKMDFPISFKRITISNKVFIKEDELRVHQQNPIKNIRKFSKKRQPMISFILFNDLLILAKKKGLKFLVIDYCERINIEATETKYKSIVSSADVSEIASSVDFDDSLDDLNKNPSNSLSRSKTSLTSDDWKRLSATFTNSLRSMPLINRTDEQEIINNSFALRFLKSQTDIFSIPIVFLAKNKLERDEWMALLSNPNLGNNVKNFSTTDPKLRKTTSLRNNANRKEDYGLNKIQSLYVKRKDDDL